MREQSPAELGPEPLNRPEFPKIKPTQDREISSLTPEQELLSEFHHLLARYISGLPGTIESLSFAERRARPMALETAHVLEQVRKLAVEFDREAVQLLQKKLHLSDKEAQLAEDHFIWTRDITRAGKH